MEWLLDNLLDSLESEINQYELLTDLLRKEKIAVIGSHINTIQEIGKEKEERLCKIHHLEQKRLDHLNVLAERLNCRPQELTLTRLSHLPQASYAERFKQTRHHLSKLMENVQKMNTDNMDLYNHLLKLTRESLSFLTQLTESGPVYHRTGHIKNRGLSGRILSGSVSFGV